MSKRAIVFKNLAKEKGITLCKVQLGRLEKAGKFPRRIQISPGRVGWLENEIDAYLDQKAADRGEAHDL